MANINELSAASSQLFALSIKDRNKAPIKANKLKLDGIVYTGNDKNKGFKFSIDNDVATNCVILFNMIILNIKPLLSIGRIFIYTKVYYEENIPISSPIVVENNQPLDIEIVKSGTFMENRQGAIFDDVYLPIVVSNNIIAWSNDTDDDIRTFMQTKEFTDYIKTIINTNNLAEKNLSNISNDDFLKKAKSVGLAENDLEDIDLAKLYDKGKDAKLAAADLSNVDMSGFATNTLSNVDSKGFDKLLKTNAAFIALENS